MTRIPQDVIDHCQKHPGCKGCPLGTCVGPVAPYPDPRWDQFFDECVEKVRDLYREAAK